MLFWHLPGSAAHIVSVGIAEGKDKQFTFRNGRCEVTDADGDELINTHKSGGVYKIRAYRLGSLNVASSKISKAEIWHQRLNHPVKVRCKCSTRPRKWKVQQIETV